VGKITIEDKHFLIFRIFRQQTIAVDRIEQLNELDPLDVNACIIDLIWMYDKIVGDSFSCNEFAEVDE